MATTRYIWIDELHGGQWELTNGRDSVTLRKDYSITPIAVQFGMRLRHKNGCIEGGSTDGTVRCDNCGQTVDAFYDQSYDYLDRVIAYGRRVVDPGYFTA
jgi:hypothetical protein